MFIIQLVGRYKPHYELISNVSIKSFIPNTHIQMDSYSNQPNTFSGRFKIEHVGNLDIVVDLDSARMI